ncbi:proteasome regulatory subunit, putative [Entamoeba histolytica HM-1:IMSS-B]|uniref:Proteasome regulatory subunit, putative n=7 Tax=Entamoeba histolytica TaxID=5759 RepID=C4LV41_ENTH1|nr:proteasome regulatory subunit, putative [Entamoeba histolytica HM-1:IMSS]EMD45044.1 proteasome regulatory subunit, putative [Entamoeba histolytica KU27]EMH72318.1 proteasome regulatory subunit, putative [Entamoeba histolytica HM-1:IMSS-B]ENY63604.1 proteasome regulatory subunit, putative [Entamoeba histolytica HM-1:IMSS-A]BAN38333.1 proteasome regulatory subunit, putative [Entamoeba histolytica]EAL51313.1 proteasome regulatory subunit, putative [Entamoeba histolytica HM-1:IMSS]|eukprot:XP_656698.1 proteasome regulatory subunit, putative [Entamoeba histolytica HM-1:IMSS]
MSEIVASIKHYSSTNDINGLNNYVQKICGDKTMSKAKIVKTLFEILDTLSGIPNSSHLLISVCEQTIEWAKVSNRTYLRQKLEQRLAQYYYENGQCSKALPLITELLKNAKRTDDKVLAVELQLLEAKVHRKVKNLTKARGAMTGARVDANSIYINPTLQGELDICSGFINGEEHDYITAASYFYEAFENYHSLSLKTQTISALKYLILMKLMQKKINEIDSVLSSKNAIGYSDDIEIVSIKEVSKAFNARSIEMYDEISKKFNNQLFGDEFVKENLTILYDALVQENIARVLEPYSSIELSHVSKLVGMEVHAVEKVISIMILEEKINGIIDQNNGILILYDDITSNKILSNGITLIEELSKAIDSLNDKAIKVIQETTLSTQL